MDIQQYYKQSALTHLNASVIAFIPVVFLLLFAVIIHQVKLFLFFMFPFLLYSGIAYVSYLINSRRSEKIEKTDDSDDIYTPSLLNTSDVLLTFLPAPSLRMLLFASNGKTIGEIRDLKFWVVRWYMPAFIDHLFKKKYGLYNSDEKLLCIFVLSKKKIEIRTPNGKIVSVVKEEKTDQKAEKWYSYQKAKLKMSYSLLFTNVVIENRNGLPLATVKKGWMPKEWGERFFNPNTPILTFHHQLMQTEIIHLYAILTKMYAYRDH